MSFPATVKEIEPVAVDKRGAMELLGIKSVTQFVRVARDPQNVDVFPKPFRYRSKGDPYYSVEKLKAFVKWREKQGLE